MPQNSCERLRSNLSFSNVLVTVHSPAQRNLRIVHMKYRHVLDPDRAVNLPDCRSQPALAPDIVSRSKQVCRIQACSSRHVSQPRQNLSHFFQPRANRRAHPRGVLDQDSQSAHGSPFRCLLQGLHDCRDRMLRFRLASRARVHHQKIRSESHGAHDLIMERLDRARPQHRLGSCQIDQVICMNDQRSKPQLVPPRPKRLRVHFRNPR